MSKHRGIKGVIEFTSRYIKILAYEGVDQATNMSGRHQ